MVQNGNDKMHAGAMPSQVFDKKLNLGCYK